MSAKIAIPDALKADVPQTPWGKVLIATPVVMTVIATLLAGLSSGEMTRAQYDRALAAQQQSKAGDQWSYFQAKRLRAALQRNSLDLLHSTTGVRPLDGRALADRLAGTPAQATLNSDSGKQALDCLARGTLPSAGPDLATDARITSVLAAVDAGQSDADIAKLLTPLKESDLTTALRDAATRVRNFDTTLKPLTSAIDAMERELTAGPAVAASPDVPNPIARDYIYARLNYAAQRYETESRQNQIIAQLYELQVRQSNTSAERHRGRSQSFFYGMLVAQGAVIISTFSMAARQRSFLWALAAAAGMAAAAFAAYIYLFV
jgi:hypothetical protein